MTVAGANAMPRPTTLVQLAANQALKRYLDAKMYHEQTARINWLGTLAITFTTDELQLICDNFTMDETLTLRALGVLTEDQGFDGAKKKRARK